MSSNRHDDLDRLKGLAILLVVVGHLVSREPPVDAQWYSSMKQTIYLFHMPLFMFLCGLMAGYTEKPIGSFREYASYASKKCRRLMPAYLLFSGVIFAGKYFGGMFAHVDNPVVSVTQYFDVMLDPHASYCAFLWFIQVLLYFYLLLPVANLITKGRIEYCLPLCFAAQFFELSSFLAFSSLVEYSFVFVLGALAGRHYESYSGLVDRWGALAVGPFVVLLAFAVPWGVPKFAMGLLSIPACHALIRTRWAEAWTALKVLGVFTFPIYLLNTLCIGVTKGVLFKFSTWDGIHFLWFGPALLVAGILGPILIKRVILSRIAPLDRVVA